MAKETIYFSDSYPCKCRRHIGVMDWTLGQEV